MKLWTLATGRYDDTSLYLFELGGVFTHRQDAIDHAQDERDAVWSTEVDLYYGPDTVIPPDTCWPLQETTEYCTLCTGTAHVTGEA